ncbi:MAG: hypothetical protein ABFC30_02400 [Proteiniphilum sp.]
MGTSTLAWELFPEEESTTVIPSHEGEESFLDEGSNSGILPKRVMPSEGWIFYRV